MAPLGCGLSAGSLVLLAAEVEIASNSGPCFGFTEVGGITVGIQDHVTFGGIGLLHLWIGGGCIVEEVDCCIHGVDCSLGLGGCEL
jgi:hypothetical protein